MQENSNAGSLHVESYFFIYPMSVVGNVRVTVAGDNATFFCSGIRNTSIRPVWWFKATNWTEFEVVHNGEGNESPRYENHFTIGSSSYLTLMNASLEFAGKYKCQKTPNGESINEFELVILGK
jgi:hypothetical protein